MPTYRLDIEVNGHDNASSVLTKVGGSLGGFGEIATGALRHIGELAVDTALTIGGALADQGAAALKAAGEYEQNLDVFQAVTGATGGQMDQLRATAKALGADMDLPGTSAAGAAAAMLELGKAGLSVDNVLLAAKGTLQLSAAGVKDNGRAAEITANALMAFGLAGDRATLVADQLAAVANKSSVEVTDVADSMKMASSVFSAFQGPVVGAETAMTQLNAAIGLLGNVGIKGSDAGTSLKQMLLQLTGPSQVAKDQMKALYLATLDSNKVFEDGSSTLDHFGQVMHGTVKERGEALKLWAQQTGQDLSQMGDIAYDAAGNMRSFPEIIGLVTKATAGMADEQRNAAITSIFGADASRAVIALMQAGPAAFDEMTAAITKQGAAGEAAAAMNRGLLGAFDGLKSVWETLQLAMAEPLLEPVAAGVRSVGEALAAAQPTLVTFVETYLVPAANGVASFLDGFVQAPDKIGYLQTAISDGFGGIQGYISTNLPNWKGTLAQWAGAAVDWLVELSPVAVERVGGYVGNLINAGMEALPGIIDMFGKYAVIALDWISGAAPGAAERTGGFVGSILDTLGRNTPPIVEALGRVGAKFISWVGDAIPKLEPELNRLGDKLGTWISDRAPIIAEKLTKWAIELGQWVVKGNDETNRLLGVLLTSVTKWLVDHGPEIGSALWQGFKGGVEAAAPGYLNEILTFLTAGLWGPLTAWWGVNSPSTKMMEFAGYLLDGLRQGATGGLGKIGEIATSIGMAFNDKIREWFGAFTDTGSYLVQGLWQGVQNSWQSTLVGPLRDLAAQLPEPIRQALGIASPSKLLADQAGQWLFPGVVVGAEQSLPAAAAALQATTTDLLARARLGAAMQAFTADNAISAFRAQKMQEFGLVAQTSLPRAGLDLPAGAALGGGGGTGSGTGGVTIVLGPGAVVVQGSVVTERDLVSSIVDGLRIASRQNGGLAAMGVAL